MTCPLSGDELREGHSAGRVESKRVLVIPLEFVDRYKDLTRVGAVLADEMHLFGGFRSVDFYDFHDDRFRGLLGIDNLNFFPS